MEKSLPYFAVFLVLLYALYNALFQDKKSEIISKNPSYIEHTKIHKTMHYEDELKQLHTTPYIRDYIISVIDHGSNQFDFTAGEMEGGFAPAADSEKIACYVLEFSGKKCVKPYNKDAALFYSSNCAGCHGEDGKGLNGTHPDLTRETLLGIEKREAFLKRLEPKENNR
jgi:hypothetical protein